MAYPKDRGPEQPPPQPRVLMESAYRWVPAVTRPAEQDALTVLRQCLGIQWLAMWKKLLLDTES